MRLKKFTIEAALWLKRLMIITGIYFYTAHLIASMVESRVHLFDLLGSSYSLINEQIFEDEIKTRVAYEKMSKTK